MALSNTFSLEVVSPEGIIFQENIQETSVPTLKGQITILPHHAPLFTKLIEGEILITKEGKKISIAVMGGFLEIKNNSVQILSDYAIRAESIEIAKAEERKRKAQETIKSKEGKKEFIVAEKDLRKSILELKVAQKIRKKHTG